MFDLVNGIPVHPLVVHAIVVLLPLTVLGTLALAAVPRWRVTYGPLVVASGLLSVVLLPVATSSGEELEKRVGDPGEHAELGEMLIWFAIPLLVLVTAMWWLARRQERSHASQPSTVLVTSVAVLAVLAALATSVQVYRVGDSGAKAVWEDAASATS
jgi:uncharacterized membrane protein YidH (DUF202 family)